MAHVRDLWTRPNPTHTATSEHRSLAPPRALSREKHKTDPAAHLDSEARQGRRYGATTWVAR